MLSDKQKKLIPLLLPIDEAALLILDVVCKFYKVDVAGVKAGDRKNQYAAPRHRAISILRDFGYTISAISKHFGQRVETIKAAIDNVRDLRDAYEAERQEYFELRDNSFRGIRPRIGFALAYFEIEIEKIC